MLSEDSAGFIGSGFPSDMSANVRTSLGVAYCEFPTAGPRGSRPCNAIRAHGRGPTPAHRDLVAATTHHGHARLPPATDRAHCQLVTDRHFHHGLLDGAAILEMNADYALHRVRVGNGRSGKGRCQLRPRPVGSSHAYAVAKLSQNPIC